MKISADSLIAALLDPRFYLSGDEDGGVSLHCRDHFDGGRPLAYYGDTGTYCTDPAVASVATVPDLWEQAVHHRVQHAAFTVDLYVPSGADPTDVGRKVVAAIKEYEGRGDGPEPQPA